MDKINPRPAKKVIKILEKIGFSQIRKIINDAKITRNEWLELIKTV